MVKIFILLFVVFLYSEVGAEIIRPCRSLRDYRCIRNNLAANSNCKKHVQGKLPSKYTVKKFRFEAPYFNSSYVDYNLIVKGHNKCYVSEFFMNNVTDKAVLGINCPGLDLESDRVLIQHRSLKEDTYYFYHIHATYPLIRITVNLPSTTHMDLCSAHVFTDVAAMPFFHIDPKDQRTAKFLTSDLSLMDIFERENFYYRGFPLMRIFVDSLICDFGCPLKN